MARDEIIALARAVVEKEGWTWLEPVDARLVRRFGFFGGRHWRVTTNYRKRGCNARIEIDDETGTVLNKRFLPR
jgi:hypothetical protein